jgi:Flp pilus assembly protein TadG
MATLTTDGRWPVRTGERGQARHGERGQAIVELALTLPLLLLVLLGIFDFGLMFQRFEVVANAAREGARVAVLPGYLPAQAETHAQNYLAAGGVTPATVNCTQSTVTLSTSPTKTVDVMQCTVDYTHNHIFVGQIMSLFGSSLATTNLRATSKMRKES